MLESIPDPSWRLDATDPLLLTRLLDIPDLRVKGVEYRDDQQMLHVFCEHTTHTACCPTCQQPSTLLHPYHPRAVRDLAWSQKRCLLEFCVRRFWCEACACPFREELAWLPRGSRLTARYRQFIFARCRSTNLWAVAQTEQLGYKSVERLYYQIADQQSLALLTKTVRQLGIDEFSVHKGHDSFALTLSDLEAGQVIALLPDRKKETLEAYFATWTQAQRDAVEEVAMDLWEPYAHAVETCLPTARIVADRFHVMKNLNDQVSGARRDLQRDLPEEAKKSLKGCRWLLVRNAADLHPTDKAKLATMFGVAPDLERLYRFKEEFRTLFETQTDQEHAACGLRRWIASVEASGITKLSKFVTLLQKRFDHILNYFHTRLSSGKVEGLNNKIKVIKRCAYGFRNFEHFTLRILVECDGTT